ncbi:MAG: MBL fold metallo-hydrolase [Gammaproteobacteria bacterium]|nr:MBL fold metallo-hydrolase [Gammaproteobacteria bacterium]
MMKKMLRYAGCACMIGMLLVSSAASAQTAGLKLQKINKHVYAIVGPYGNRTAKNFGNNATFGFVVTNDGVVLIDSGGSYLGAAAIDKLIRQVTDSPVKIVINTGGQDHRWLGNGYFKAQGARVLASEAAVVDQRERLQDQMFMLGNLIGTKALQGTEAVYADETFTEEKTFTFGGVQFVLKKVGPAHTPGDSLVYLPQDKIVFSGDVVFVGRLLGVLPHSNSRHWVSAFETMAALQPQVVVPGHGPVTDLAQARKDTYDYLVFLRELVGTFMESGGDITRIGALDQSRFAYLVDYDSLKGRNAQQVYQAMEWE